MTRLFLVALAPLLALPVSRAQQVSLAPQDPPLLSMTEAANTVRLQQAKVDTIVLGGLAQTTVELVFFNYGDRLLEGQLNFPLRDGQRITGFALDVDGKMRDAVPVPKQKGRVAFESIERRRVDPALLEQTAGNHFRLRVYPIPQGGTRTVRLVYSEDLALGQGQYRLPVSLAQLRGAADLQWSLRVQAAARAPTASGTLARSLAFKQVAGGWEATLQRSRFDGRGTLDVQLPNDQQARVYTQQSGDEIYFLAEQPLPQNNGAAPRRALPQKVAVLWDSSASARERNREAELSVLSRYLAALGNAEVSLVRLRDVAEPAQPFSIRAGDAGALLAALRDTVYDGASQLTGWKPLPGVQEYLLFSDGLQNYGNQRDLPTLPSDVRLYALHAAGAHADALRLRQWAESRSGHLIAIDPTTPQAAVEDLLSTPAQLLDVELIGGDDWVVPTYAPRDGMLRVAGRLVAQQGQLRLRYRDAQGRAQEASLLIDARQAALSGPVPQTWASYWIQRWSADPESHRQQIRQTSERFGLVSAQTSLIVLETVQDYVEHGIAPPAELQAEYSRLREQQRIAHDGEEAERLEDVAERFQARIRWWEKPWPKGSLPTAEPIAKREQQRRREAASQAREASATAAAAPPPAAMSVQEDQRSVPLQAPGTITGSGSSDTLDSVVVTGNGVDSESDEPKIQVTVQPWQPDSPYAQRLRAASGKQVYRLYLDEREANR
ncbi:MAG TPA: VIT domain-containing protein, partial [Pseudoxanthomonas sp.]|nr:VIT domain-containing protein [Pseudoxanthomonas sp.]